MPGVTKTDGFIWVKQESYQSGGKGLVDGANQSLKRRPPALDKILYYYIFSILLTGTCSILARSTAPFFKDIFYMDK